jgi:hypothetical protein
LSIHGTWFSKAEAPGFENTMGILQWLNGLWVGDQGYENANVVCESRKERRLRIETKKDRHCWWWWWCYKYKKRDSPLWPRDVVTMAVNLPKRCSIEPVTMKRLSRDATVDEPLGTMQRNSTHIEYNQRCLSQTYSLVKCSYNPSVGRGIWEVSLVRPNSRPAKNWVEVAQSRNRSTIYGCLDHVRSSRDDVIICSIDGSSSSSMCPSSISYSSRRGSKR